MVDHQSTEVLLSDTYKKGLNHLEKGYLPEAIRIFRSMLDSDPNYPKAHAGIAMAKTRKLGNAGLIKQKIYLLLFLLQGVFYKKIKKYGKALDKYENISVLSNPPIKLLAGLADVYHENGMIDMAIRNYVKVLSSYPEDISSLRKVGKLFLSKNDALNAKKVYSSLSSLASSDDAVARDIKDAYAQLSVMEGGWEKEGSFRQKLATTDQAREEQQVANGKSAQEQGMSQNIQINLLEGRLTKDPDNVRTRLELAELYATVKRYDKAIQQYLEITKVGPVNNNMLKALAHAYTQTGEFEKAIKIYEKAAELYPNDQSVLEPLAGLYIEDDSSLKAISTYKKIIEFSPDEEHIHEKLGNLYEQNRYFQEAIEEYGQVIKLNSAKSNLRIKIADLFLREGNIPRAIIEFEQVVQQDSEDIGTMKRLAELYTKNHDIDKAEKTYKGILAVLPKARNVSSTTAMAISETLKDINLLKKNKLLKETESQIESCKRALSKDPGNRDALAKLEEIEKNRGEIQKEFLEEKVRLQPKNWGAHFELGMLYKNLKNYNEAIAAFQKSAENKEHQIESIHMLGLCFAEKGMLDISAKQFERAEKLLDHMDSQKKEILYDMGKVYEKMNKREKAIEKFKNIFEHDIAYKDVAEKIEETYK